MEKVKPKLQLFWFHLFHQLKKDKNRNNLLPILYLHNMRYQTDPMTQSREKRLQSRKVLIFHQKLGTRTYHFREPKSRN